MISLRGALISALGVFALLQAQPVRAAATYGATAPSTTVVAPTLNQVASQQSASLISGRVSQAVANVSGSIGSNLGSGGTGGGFQGGGFQGGGAPGGAPGGGGRAPGPQSSVDGAGKAAGSAPPRWGMWANASHADLRNTQAGADFDASVIDALAGIDAMVTDRLLLGVAGGFESTNVKTHFNDGTLKGQGWALAPYGAFIINKVFSIDATIGRAEIDYDSSRQFGAVSGHTNGTRWFASVSGNANTMVDNWVLGSSLGFLYATETQDAYTETDGSEVDETKTRLGQMRLTPKVGYRLPMEFGSVTPYGSARLEYDVNKTPAQPVDSVGTMASDSRFGTTFAVGVNANIGDGLSANLEASSTQFRENIETTIFSGTIRYRF